MLLVMLVAPAPIATLCGCMATPIAIASLWGGLAQAPKASLGGGMAASPIASLLGGLAHAWVLLRGGAAVAGVDGGVLPWWRGSSSSSSSSSSGSGSSCCRLLHHCLGGLHSHHCRQGLCLWGWRRHRGSLGAPAASL